MIKRLSQRFESLYSGVVYDALAFDLGCDSEFVVHREIAPVSAGRGTASNQRAVFGRAATCRGEAVRNPETDLDDMVRFRMFDSFSPGCVQVLETGGDESVAHFGDISALLARRAGAVGAVIDGFTRDSSLIAEMGFPLFCRGTLPIDAFGRWQIVDFDITISLRGQNGPVPVSPADFIFADGDGVLIIPGGLVEEVLVNAEARASRENKMRRDFANGRDIFETYAAEGRW